MFNVVAVSSDPSVSKLDTQSSTSGSSTDMSPTGKNYKIQKKTFFNECNLMVKQLCCKKNKGDEEKTVPIKSNSESIEINNLQ